VVRGVFESGNLVRRAGARGERRARARQKGAYQWQFLEIGKIFLNPVI